MSINVFATILLVTPALGASAKKDLKIKADAAAASGYFETNCPVNRVSDVPSLVLSGLDEASSLAKTGYYEVWFCTYKGFDRSKFVENIRSLGFIYLPLKNGTTDINFTATEPGTRKDKCMWSGSDYAAMSSGTYQVGSCDSVNVYVPGKTYTVIKKGLIENFLLLRPVSAPPIDKLRFACGFVHGEKGYKERYDKELHEAYKRDDAIIDKTWGIDPQAQKNRVDEVMDRKYFISSVANGGNYRCSYFYPDIMSSLEAALKK